MVNYYKNKQWILVLPQSNQCLEKALFKNKLTIHASQTPNTTH